MSDVRERLESLVEHAASPPPMAGLVNRALRRRRARRARAGIALGAIVVAVAVLSVGLRPSARPPAVRVVPTAPSTPTSSGARHVEPTVRFGTPVRDDSSVAFAALFADGSMWIRRDSTVERRDEGGHLEAEIAVPREGAPDSLLFAAGSLWVANQTLVRIDPRTNRVIATLPIDAEGLVEHDGVIWVRTSTQFVELDPRTNRVVRHFARVSQGSFGATRQALWTVDGCFCLSRIDERTLQETDVHIAAGSILATTPDAVWVLIGSSRLVEIDARTARPVGEPIDAQGINPFATVVGDVLFVGTQTNGGATIAAYDIATRRLLARLAPQPTSEWRGFAVAPRGISILSGVLYRVPLDVVTDR